MTHMLFWVSRSVSTFVFCDFTLFNVWQATTSDADIKRAFRKLSGKYHPDKDPSPEAAKKFSEVRAAYEVVGDEDKRMLFDTGGNYS